MRRPTPTSTARERLRGLGPSTHAWTGHGPCRAGWWLQLLGRRCRFCERSWRRISTLPQSSTRTGDTWARRLRRAETLQRSRELAISLWLVLRTVTTTTQPRNGGEGGLHLRRARRQGNAQTPAATHSPVIHTLGLRRLGSRDASSTFSRRQGARSSSRAVPTIVAHVRVSPLVLAASGWHLALT